MNAGRVNDIEKQIASALRLPSWLSLRVVKYGLVGCTGILVNLAVIAVLFKLTTVRGGLLSAAGTMVSSVTNFIFHNVWTFSDRRHQGKLRMVRGYFSYLLSCALGIGATTGSYVALVWMAARVPFTISHGVLFIPLVCQTIAIFLGASINYILNREYTWPRQEAAARGEATQALET